MPTQPSIPAPLTAHAFLWIETPAGRFLGKGRVGLLEKVQT